MSTDMPNPDQVVDRLEALEKFVGSLMDSDGTLKARGIVISADDGTIRGDLKVDANGCVALRLRDGSGRSRAVLAVARDGSTTLDLWGLEGPRSRLGVDAGGLPYLDFVAGDGNSRMQFDVTEDGMARIVLRD